MRLLLIGSIPPPQGGIGVHISRLRHLLEANGYDVDYLDESPVIKPDVENIRNLNVLSIFNVIKRCEIIHVHTSIDLLRICYLLAAKVMRKRCVVTIHSWRGKSQINQKLQKTLLRTANRIVCVNEDIKQNLNLKNVVVRNAFIPPDDASQPPLPSDVEQWIKDKTDAGKQVVSSNSFRLDKYNGEDLYGLDMCIELAAFLIKKEKRNIAFVFCVASANDKTREAYDRFSKLIDQYELREHFLLVLKEHLSFVRVLAKSTLTIRTTNTDGDALSVRESLHFGVPVIASDCVQRPSGTILFETRNQASLNEVTLHALDDCANNVGIPGSEINGCDFEFYNTLYLA